MVKHNPDEYPWVCAFFFVFHMRTMPDVTYSFGRCVANDRLYFFVVHPSSLSCSFVLSIFLRAFTFAPYNSAIVSRVNTITSIQQKMMLFCKIHIQNRIHDVIEPVFGVFCLYLSLHGKISTRGWNEIAIKFSTIHPKEMWIMCTYTLNLLMVPSLPTQVKWRLQFARQTVGFFKRFL